MTSVSFKGFTAGSTVTIGGMTVNAWGGTTSGGTTSGGAIWDQTPSPGVTVTINPVRSAFRVAPEGVFFTATVSGFNTDTSGDPDVYDPSYHDKVYFWDYGESYIFTAPEQVIAMDAADGGNRSDSRYSRGPLGAHVFRTPGMYTVRLAVLEPSSGKLGIASAQISMATPDTFYAGSTTLFVDQTGRHANAPSGAQRFTSLDAAFTALNVATTPHRIVLERGQTHTLNDYKQFRPPSNSSGITLRIEARKGAGARPVVTTSGSFVSGMDQAPSNESTRPWILDNSLAAANCPSETVISGIEFSGPWDPATQTGEWGYRVMESNNAGAASVLFDDCYAHGFNRMFANQGSGTRNTRRYFISDTHITDWSDYGFFDGDHGYTSVIGSRITQNVDAISRLNKERNNNWHGPLRVSDPNKTLVVSSDLFCANGWSVLTGSHPAIQPCFRWNTSPLEHGGAQLNMQSCVLESGNLAFAAQAHAHTQPSRQTNALVEGCVMVAGFQAVRIASVSHGGMTMRNNLAIYADTEHNATSIGGANRQPNVFVETPANGDGNGTDAANLAAPIRIYNNTFVNLTGSAVGVIWQDSRMGFQTVEVENNILHEPGSGSAYPGLSAQTVFNCRYKGFRRDSSTLYTQHATPVDSGAYWVPQIGSPALGAALREPNACTDFRGGVRPEPPSLGAFEVD